MKEKGRKPGDISERDRTHRRFLEQEGQNVQLRKLSRAGCSTSNAQRGNSEQPNESGKQESRKRSRSDSAPLLEFSNLAFAPGYRIKVEAPALGKFRVALVDKESGGELAVTEIASSLEMARSGGELAHLLTELRFSRDPLAALREVESRNSKVEKAEAAA